MIQFKDNSTQYLMVGDAYSFAIVNVDGEPIADLLAKWEKSLLVVTDRVRGAILSTEYDGGTITIDRLESVGDRYMVTLYGQEADGKGYSYEEYLPLNISQAVTMPSAMSTMSSSSTGGKRIGALTQTTVLTNKGFAVDSDGQDEAQYFPAERMFSENNLIDDVLVSTRTGRDVRAYRMSATFNLDNYATRGYTAYWRAFQDTGTGTANIFSMDIGGMSSHLALANNTVVGKHYIGSGNAGEEIWVQIATHGSHVDFASVTASGAITALSTSDDRLKERQPRVSYLDRLVAMGHVFEYKYNDVAVERGECSERVHTGLSAQDVEGVIPSMVHTDEDGYRSLNYLSPDYINTLTGAIGELLAIVRDQGDRIKQLEDKEDGK